MMLQDQVAAVGSGGDVEEGQFVGALFVVATRDLDRIAGVAQLDEVDALDDAPGGDVEAGNDAFGKRHGWSVSDSSERSASGLNSSARCCAERKSSVPS